jgi:hypothetical protein
VEGYGKPTLLLHSDTHLFRVDKPLFSAKIKRPFEKSRPSPGSASRPSLPMPSYAKV